MSLLLVPLVLAGCVSGAVLAPGYVTGDASNHGGTGRAASRDAADARESELNELLAADALDLDALLRIAELRNPDIAAAWHDLGAASGRRWQAEAYPNPELEIEAEDIPVSDVAGGRGQIGVSITQPVILGGRRSAAIRAATADKEAMRLEVEVRRRDVLVQVRLAYVELTYLVQAIALRQELLGLARETLNIATIRFDARAAPESEVIKTQLEVHELELGQRRRRHEQAAALERLRALLGGVEVALDRIAGALTEEPTEIDRDHLRRRAWQNHPALLAAAMAIEAADMRVEQAEAERVPDLGVRLGYAHDLEGNQDVLNLGFSLPLPLFDQNYGRILETRHLAQRARREAESVANALLAELAQAHADYLASRDELVTFRDEIVPAASRAFEQAREAYRTGRSSLLDLLDAQRTLAWSRLSLLESVRDTNLAWARLWKVVGPALEG